MKVYKDEEGIIVIDFEGAKLDGNGQGTVINYTEMKELGVRFENFIASNFYSGMTINPDKNGNIIYP